MPPFAPTPRTRFVRSPGRGSYDRELAYAILDETHVCHVGFVADGSPFVIPINCWRVGDELMIHAARSGRMARALAAGAEACVSVALLDGMVLARSAYHHAVNYRSVMVFGRARVVEGEEKTAALAALVDHFWPGRSAKVRPPSPAELKATAVLAFPLDEASVKMRTGGPNDDADDMALPVWAGVVPLRIEKGEPVHDPRGGSAAMQYSEA